MDRFFSILGKIMLGTILLIIVLGGGYLFGTYKNASRLSPSPTGKIPPITKATLTAAPTKQPTPTTESPTASPSGVVQLKTNN